MAAIAASDVTYTVSQRDLAYVNGKIEGSATITVGDGALTYPSGGIPLTKGKLGCSRDIEWLDIVESNATGYMFEYDVSAEKLRIFYIPDLDGNAANAQALDELATDETPAAMSIVVHYRGQK